jgi:hypothetical protein
MLFINGEVLPGLEDATTAIFGTNPVSGTAEIARTQRKLGEQRFLAGRVIPIIGEEHVVRSFTPTTNPNMFDYLRMIQPVGLITFGVGTPGAAKRKPNGTHMDIVLREWAKDGILSLAIEGIYYEEREAVLKSMSEMVGSRAVTMSRLDDSIQITTA